MEREYSPWSNQSVDRARTQTCLAQVLRGIGQHRYITTRKVTMRTEEANGATPIDKDMVDTIGLAFGFALAVYDRTTSNGGPLDRINQTCQELFDSIEDERFSEPQAAVLEGIAAGLSSYMRTYMRQQAGTQGEKDKFI